jgi:hypothetical protein
MPTQPNNGTQTAVIDTIHTLATITTTGVYELAVDTNAMVAGDTLVLRVNDRVLTGGSNRLTYSATYANAQATFIKKSPPIVVLFNCTFTLEQQDGTGRNFPWAINKIDA